ncbi:hypothetical protein F2Q69_00048904 [Brassica cretica]|uniref:Uncharacterized protein n=1 Tax=Brassica cretica TaxID=69181 RepID=A0A8S9PKU3_BRACR|nr:hypothetical protein F2Q69_00048904 [Brassica cretica]
MNNIRLMYVIPCNALSDFSCRSVIDIQCMVKRPCLNEGDTNRYSFKKVMKLKHIFPCVRVLQLKDDSMHLSPWAQSNNLTMDPIGNSQRQNLRQHRKSWTCQPDPNGNDSKSCPLKSLGFGSDINLWGQPMLQFTAYEC